jgi:hypothetical protein
MAGSAGLPEALSASMMSMELPSGKVQEATLTIGATRPVLDADHEAPPTAEHAHRF